MLSEIDFLFEKVGNVVLSKTDFLFKKVSDEFNPFMLWRLVIGTLNHRKMKADTRWLIPQKFTGNLQLLMVL